MVFVYKKWSILAINKWKDYYFYLHSSSSYKRIEYNIFDKTKYSMLSLLDCHNLLLCRDFKWRSWRSRLKMWKRASLLLELICCFWFKQQRLLISKVYKRYWIIIDTVVKWSDSVLWYFLRKWETLKSLNKKPLCTNLSFKVCTAMSGTRINIIESR
jgi:hypothetical protein